MESVVTALAELARIIFILVSVAGIGVCFGTGFVCAIGVYCETKRETKVTLALYCVICVALCAAFSWMLVTNATMAP